MNWTTIAFFDKPGLGIMIDRPGPCTLVCGAINSDAAFAIVREHNKLNAQVKFLTTECDYLSKDLERSRAKQEELRAESDRLKYGATKFGPLKSTGSSTDFSTVPGYGFAR